MKDLLPGRLRRLLGRIYGGDSLPSVVARGASWSYLLNFTGLGLSAALQVVLARILGTEGYGTYVYLLGWMNLVLVFVKFDFDLVCVKYVALYSDPRKSALLKGLLTVGLGSPALFSVLTGVAAALGIWLLQGMIDSAFVLPAMITAMILPCATLTEVFRGALEGRKLIAYAQLPAVLQPLLKLSSVGFWVLVFGYELEAAGALTINLLTVSVTLGTLGFLLWPQLSRLKGVARHFRYREWFGTAAGLLPASLAQLTLGHTIDVVIVGTFVGAALAGVYGISAYLLLPAMLVMQASGSIARPLIAHLFAHGEQAELQRLVTLVGRINIALAAPMVLGLYLVGSPILGWIGDDYRAGYPVVVLLGFGVLSATLGGHAAIVLTMTGHERRASFLIGVSAAVNVALALLLAPRFGLIGVATATAIATVLRNVLMVGAARRRTGLLFRPIL